jgi:hypothetical protein
MSLRVYYEVLNQKGSPALYTDTFANRPTFGFQGRLFISTDTGQIFEDTGTAWTLVADAGVGGGTLSSVTANGNTTAFGIVITAGGLSSTTGTFSGIVTTPQVKASTSAGLSINANSGTQIALLGAGGGANMTLYGQITGTDALFQNISALGSGIGTITTDFVNLSNQLQITTRASGGPTYTTGTANIGSLTAGFYITRGLNGGGILAFDSSATYTYTYPAASGTLALTSDLGTYLPLAGGTLTGALNINRSSGNGLNVAADTMVFRSNTGVSTPRQLEFSMGGATSTFLDAKGYGANYITDFGIRTYNASGTAFNVFYGDSAGNVGIGNVAPSYKLDVTGISRITSTLQLGSSSSTWDLAGFNAQFFGDTGTLYGGSTQMAIINNGTHNGSSFIYRTTNFANLLTTDSGQFDFSTAPSGTVGNNITFTTRARLTNSGNFLIGSTTDNGNGKLQVNGNITFGSFGSVLTATSTNVTTSAVNVGNTTGAGISCLYFAAWFNNSGGAQGNAVLMVRSGSVTTISISDGSGAVVVFSASGSMLRANTTTGSVTMGVSQINI